MHRSTAICVPHCFWQAALSRMGTASTGDGLEFCSELSGTCAACGPGHRHVRVPATRPTALPLPPHFKPLQSPCNDASLHRAMIAGALRQ